LPQQVDYPTGDRVDCLRVEPDPRRGHLPGMSHFGPNCVTGVSQPWPPSPPHLHPGAMAGHTNRGSSCVGMSRDMR
jgi:hypothetical protein